MKEDASKYLFNEAVKYLGRYPATQKKIKEHLKNKIKSKKINNKIVFPEDLTKEEIIDYVTDRLDKLKIINEDNFIESLFYYYQKSLYSVKKIKNKLFQKGFDQKVINEFIYIKFQENPQLEVDILKQYIVKKKLERLDKVELKKKLYQQNFSESSIFTVINDVFT